MASALSQILGIKARRLKLRPGKGLLLYMEARGPWIRTCVGCTAEQGYAEDGLLLIAKATGGIMRRIDVLATRCLELAAPAKSNLVEVTVAEAAIRDCAEALL